MKLARSKRQVFICFIIGGLLWGGLLAAWMNQQAIHDWWRLRGYVAPPEIARIATDTTMTDRAKHVFYVHRPVLESADEFNSICRRGNEFTIVLGCYVSNQGIYIFNVEDERLNGVEEVTAAHEMLHAVYERLPTRERNEVDRMTALAFDRLNNDRLQKTIAQYRENDASSVPGELYSILGTEVRDLPKDLELHYARFFSDRMRVVRLAERYEQAFTQRESKISHLEKQLKELRSQIEASNQALEVESRRLEREYERLESQRSSTDPVTFRTIATSYNTQVDAYNTQVRNTTVLIEKYNAIYETYESLVLEHQELFKSIDSRPKAISS